MTDSIQPAQNPLSALPNINELAEQASAARFAKARSDALSQSFFNVCAVDRVVPMKSPLRETVEYRLLIDLHCISMKDMSPELQASLPQIVDQLFARVMLEPRA